MKDVLIVRIHIRRARGLYKQFHRDFINGYNNRSIEQLVDVIEVNRLMEYIKSIMSYRKKPEETSGS